MSNLTDREVLAAVLADRYGEPSRGSEAHREFRFRGDTTDGAIAHVEVYRGERASDAVQMRVLTWPQYTQMRPDHDPYFQIELHPHGSGGYLEEWYHAGKYGTMGYRPQQMPAMLEVLCYLRGLLSGQYHYERRPMAHLYQPIPTTERDWLRPQLTAALDNQLGAADTAQLYTWPETNPDDYGVNDTPGRTFYLKHSLSVTLARLDEDILVQGRFSCRFEFPNDYCGPGAGLHNVWLKPGEPTPRHQCSLKRCPYWPGRLYVLEAVLRLRAAQMQTRGGQ